MQTNIWFTNVKVQHKVILILKLILIWLKNPKNYSKTAKSWYYNY